jgi:hypothetical protein
VIVCKQFPFPFVGVLAAAAVSVGVAASITGISLSAVAKDGCEAATGCSVPGAEVDDETTAKARAIIGSGPAVGVVADKRLQTDVEEIGKLDGGIKVYAFRYLWDDTVRVGVLAQDLLERPETKSAVLTLANGLYAVDYAALGLRQATMKQWTDDGPSSLRADYKAKPVALPIPMPQPPPMPDDAVRLFNKRPPP